jgi:DNA primase large subunit
MELVGQRRVILENGFAYVARKQLVSIVAMKFR